MLFRSDKTHKEWMVEMLQTYDMPRAAPVIEIEKLYFRNNPIFHDILSGYSEDSPRKMGLLVSILQKTEMMVRWLVILPVR